MNVIQHIKYVLCVLILMLFLQACQKQSIEESSIFESESVLHEEQSEFYITNYEKQNVLSMLNLEEEDMVLIYDLDNNKILFHIYKDYKPDEEGFRETGYASYSKRLVIFDTEKECISREISLEKNFLCTDAIFLEDQMICVYLIKNQEQEDISYEYQIVRYENDSSEIVLSSTDCVPYDDGVPWLARLNHKNFAYSYYSYDTQKFGVNIVNEQNQITPSLSFQQNIEGNETIHLDMILTKNNSEYLFYATIEGKEIVFIGNEEKVEQFEIPANERVFEFCFVGENICAMMQEVDENNSSVYMVILKDRKGVTLAKTKSELLYVMASDLSKNVLAITRKYEPVLIHCDGSISVTKQKTLPYDSESALFYVINESEFYVFYPQILELYKIKIG